MLANTRSLSETVALLSFGFTICSRWTLRMLALRSKASIFLISFARQRVE
jgi:hypothetical protein